ncbi:hypothetical protein D3C76_1546230 [compost metagenome]
MLALIRLWQPIALGIEQLRRATEEATVGEHLLKGLVGLVHAAILELDGIQVALLHFVLGQ